MTIDELKTKKEVIFGDLKDYKNWFLGAFSPAILNTKDFEIAIFDIPKGHTSDQHFHLIASELNLIISGACTVVNNGIKHKLKDGELFLFPPKVKTMVTYTKDTKLLVIKFPSVPFGDKFYSEKQDDEG